MSKAIKTVQAALQRAVTSRPKVGGFPFFADTLHRAGITRNVWILPACESLYLTAEGPVLVQGTALVTGTVDVPRFDRHALITALRLDQSGGSSFEDFLLGAWHAGVVRYEVDFRARTVSYFGCLDEVYVEAYPAIGQ
jgi:uncharacterized protein YbcV (DUF1398 family)